MPDPSVKLSLLPKFSSNLSALEVLVWLSEVDLLVVIEKEEVNFKVLKESNLWSSTRLSRWLSLSELLLDRLLVL